MSGFHRLREIVIDRLTSEFGQPLVVGLDYRWELRFPGHISMDSWRTPDQATLWVFDLRQQKKDQVTATRLTTIEGLHAFVARFKAPPTP